MLCKNDPHIMSITKALQTVRVNEHIKQRFALAAKIVYYFRQTHVCREAKRKKQIKKIMLLFSLSFVSLIVNHSVHLIAGLKIVKMDC